MVLDNEIADAKTQAAVLKVYCREKGTLNPDTDI